MTTRFCVSALLVATTAFSLACSSGAPPPPPASTNADMQAGGAAGAPTAAEGGAPAGSAGGSAAPEGGQDAELPCETDTDCDDGKACNGREQCDSGVCVSGTPVDCGAGLQCAEEGGGSCAFTDADTSPWIVYAADDDTPAQTEIYAVKRDLVGTLAPVKLNDSLEPGSTIFHDDWSPDRRWFSFRARPPSGQVTTHVLDFATGLPRVVARIQGEYLAWSPSAAAFYLSDGKSMQLYEVIAPGEIKLAITVPSPAGSSWGYWSKLNELVFATQQTSSLRRIHRAYRDGSTWQVSQLADVPNLAQLDVAPNAQEVLYEAPDAAGKAGAFWVIEMSPNSKPKLLSPAGATFQLSWSPAEDKYVFLTGSAGGVPQVLLGTGSLYSGSTTRIAATSSPESATFAPDGKQVLLFQPLEDWGTDVKLVDPAKGGSSTRTVTRMGKSDPVLAHYPSERLVISQRESPTEDAKISAYSMSHGNAEEIDTVPYGHSFRLVTLSPRGEYCLYSKGESDSDVYYVDFRYPEIWGYTPVRLPGEGRINRSRFDTTGSGLYYVREQVNGARECFYLDLSGSVAAEARKLSRTGRVDFCVPQR